jgi:hypothetical protein
LDVKETGYWVDCSSITVHIKRTALLVVGIMLAAPSFLTIQAQPVLNFKRVVNNWPTIELYFQITCDGEKKHDVNTGDFAVTENGENIGTYTVWCPDPNIKCAVSLSLAVEIASEAHRDLYRNIVAKLLFGADSFTDEFAMSWYDQHAILDAGMTISKTAILNAYNKIPIATESRYLDLTMAALHKLINESNNPCRAVVVLLDGKDTTSVNTVQDIISFANRNRIRIFGIALNSDGDRADLETIALLTGGKFYINPSGGLLQRILDELSTIIFAAFLECLVTYQASCMDGGIRTTELQLRNYCGGNNSQTKTYRAPKDTSTYVPLVLGVEPIDVVKGARFAVPFSLLTPMYERNWNKGFIADIIMPKDQVEFVSVSLPDGSLLEDPGNLTFTKTDAGIALSYAGGIEFGRTGSLCMLHFQPVSPWPDDSIVILTESVEFIGGCSRSTPYEGTIRFSDDTPLEISLLDNAVQCNPGTVRLRATAGYLNYRWSSSETSQEILASTTGDYWVTAETPNGITLVSDTQRIVVHPINPPTINIAYSSGPCVQEAAILSVPGNYVDYQWSDGSEDSSITVHNSGHYRVTVSDSNGCSYSLETDFVSLANYTFPRIWGASVSCNTHLAQYRTALDKRLTYEWEAIGGTITDYLGTTNVLIRWENDSVGYVIVRGTYESCAFIDTVEVDLTPPQVPQILVDGPRSVCNGVETILRVNKPYRFVQWSTGRRDAYIQINTPGIYTVSAGNTSSCYLTSDTVVISALPTPDKPVITRRGDSLFSTEAYTYVLSHGWNVMQGQNGQAIVALKTGSYSVVVSNEYGCTSGSDWYEVAVLGIEEQYVPADFAVDVYPTITRDVFHVSLTTSGMRQFRVSLVDIFGREIQHQYFEALDGPGTITFSLAEYPSGLYYILINSGEGHRLKKVMRALR